MLWSGLTPVSADLCADYFQCFSVGPRQEHEELLKLIHSITFSTLASQHPFESPSWCVEEGLSSAAVTPHTSLDVCAWLRMNVVFFSQTSQAESEARRPALFFIGWGSETILRKSNKKQQKKMYQAAGGATFVKLLCTGAVLLHWTTASNRESPSDFGLGVFWFNVTRHYTLHSKHVEVGRCYQDSTHSNLRIAFNYNFFLNLSTTIIIYATFLYSLTV